MRRVSRINELRTTPRHRQVDNRFFNHQSPITIMSRARKITSLGDVLSQLVKDLGFEKKFEEMQVIAQWPDVVGRQIASHTHAVSCEGGKLFVEVASASWRQELFYMKADILKRLNHGAGQKIVQDIILTNTRR